MKKNILLFIVLILVIIGVALVIAGTAPEGSSYHLNTYTNTISGASTNTIVVHDKLYTKKGLVIETRADNPAEPVIGQMWIIDSSLAIP